MRGPCQRHQTIRERHDLAKAAHHGQRLAGAARGLGAPRPRRSRRASTPAPTHTLVSSGRPSPALTPLALSLIAPLVLFLRSTPVLLNQDEQRDTSQARLDAPGAPRRRATTGCCGSCARLSQRSSCLSTCLLILCFFPPHLDHRAERRGGRLTGRTWGGGERWRRAVK
jgi:hypothetical protein